MLGKMGVATGVVALVLGLIAVAEAQTRRAPQAFDRLTPVVTPGAPALSCQANKLYACGVNGCDVEDHPTGLPVQIDLKTAEGKGYLCTYTYCRSFTWMGWKDRAPLTGLLWSSQSGSTPPYDRKPTYDYTLTIAEGWGSFTLAAEGNGMVSGFTGACKPAAGR